MGGQIFFPWFSFWRRNPIAGLRLSLFVTMVDDVLSQDPDLENAKFEILDFSAQKPKEPRKLAVIDARDVPRVSAGDKAEMLAVFAEGYFHAQEELEGMNTERREDRTEDDTRDDDQPRLFE